MTTRSEEKKGDSAGSPAPGLVLICERLTLVGTRWVWVHRIVEPFVSSQEGGRMRMVDRRKSIPYAHMKRQKKASRKERKGEG